MRRFVTESWKRTALQSCAVLLLVVAGAALQGLSSHRIAAQLSGAIVDASRAADHGLRQGQAGPRFAADRRQIEPGFDRAPPPDIAASVRLIDVDLSDDLRGAWADTPFVSSCARRVAHQVRGPPQTGSPAIRTNCGTTVSTARTGAIT